MAESEIYEVEEILDQREVEGQLQFYVKWKKFNADWNTWEPIDNLLDCFDLVLEFQEQHHIKDNSIPVVDTKKSKLARREALKIVKNAKKLNSSDSIKRALQKHAAIIVNDENGDISVVNDSLNLSIDTGFVNNVKSARSPKSPKSQKLSNSPKLTNSPNSPKSPKCKSSLTTSPNSNLKKLTGTGISTALSASPLKRTPKKPLKLKEFYNLSNVKSVKVSGVKVTNGSPKKTLSGRSDDVQTLLKIPHLISSKDGGQTIVNITSNKELDGAKVIPTKSDSKTSEGNKSKTKNVTKKTIKTLKTTGKNMKMKKTNNLLVVKMKPLKKKENKDVNTGISNLSGSKDTEVMLQRTPMNNSPVKGRQEKQNISGEKKNVKKKQTNSVKDNIESREVKKKVKKTNTIENLERNATKTKVTKTKSVTIDGEVKKIMKKNGKKEKEDKGLKRKLDQIEIIDTESDDDNVVVKYSISPNSKKLKTGNSPKKVEEVSTSKIEIPRNLGKELSKKTLQVKVKPMNHSDASSHMKKMRLIDTMKSNTGFSKSATRPVSPTPVFTSVKPIMSTARPIIPMETLCGETTGYHYVPAMIPISPSSMSYKMILDSLPFHFHPKKSNKKREEETMRDDDVERRLSVRQSECAYKYKEIVVKKCNKYTQIWLNTHTKMKNSLNPQVIQEVVSALNSAKYDDSNLVMFSGIGNVFCSGIDLTFLISMDRKMAARKMVDALRDFMKALITFPKPLIAVVTGSAIGLGMTMLPLCDIVYASDKALFYLPYSQLAQTPEGCASFMLPNTVGMAMANELLIGGRKITAIEACQLGLVSQVFWPTSIMQEVIPRIENMALQSGKALETTKLLIRSHQRTKIELTNESECNLLLERWPSVECQKAIENYLNNENNLSI